MYACMYSGSRKCGECSKKETVALFGIALQKFIICLVFKVSKFKVR